MIKKCAQFAEAAQIITDGYIHFNQTADSIVFSNGGRVLSLPSGNPSALRGYSAQAILMDEAAFIERADDVFAAIAPTLTRDRDAELIITSTPAGKSGFFWDMWNRMDDSWYKQITTIDDAVEKGLNVNIEELEDLVGNPDVFDVEYRCKFADSWGSFVDVNLLDWYDALPGGNQTKYFGMDIGSTSDRTAIVVLVEIDGIVFVDDIIILHKATYED